MEERLKFVCRNSKVKRDESLGGASEKKSGGVGLTNVKKRLELIYGNSYTLDIEDGEADYEVLLLLPLLKEEKES
jgi:sensor histidine kinase YesM